MTSSAPRGPYAKGIQRRQEILDATIDVVAEKGFEGTSLRAIGEAIGVSHAALRHYFASREELLLEVLRERDRKSQSRVADEPTVFARMAAAADDNVLAPELVALHTTMMAASVEAGDEDARAFFTERFARSRAVLAADLRNELEAAGRASDLDLEMVASLVIAAFDGLQIQWLLERSVDIAGTLRLLERILR
ncbi:TetR/AcrR family transcriptional regulator [Frondihabitans cladoniiphilus]|uniref:TetR/AcrR family transcriptional regulator n=1 Tax=Frondihabitans cladoniiphilus TaxID=715785 RepID=A0ABP8W0A4_9MICO